MRFLPTPLIALALALSACESAKPGAVDVTYRFEGVRTEKGSTDSEKIREVLQSHSGKPVTIETTPGFSGYGSVRAVVFATLDDMQAIHADLVSLGQSNPDRLAFTITAAAATYRTNYVSAGVAVHVSGVATEKFIVRIYPAPDVPVVRTVAGRSGLWSAKLDVVPDTQWVYGRVDDPSAKVPPAFFRINLASRKQERITPEEFFELFPDDPPVPPAPTPPKPADSKRSARP